jgi:hypothetical protein
MKRIVYYLCFACLGGLLGFILHALLELWYSKLLIRDFGRFGLGLSWADWFLVHNIVAIVLTLLGLWFGYRSGRKWWQILYVEQRYRKWLRRDLKQTF